MANRFLVLGSNSFSGATFCDFLAQAGHDVLATSRSEEAHVALLPYKWGQHTGRVRFRRIDINHDLDALAELLNSERPTHVVNFAAQSMVAESWAHPDQWMMTNVVSTVRLLEILRRSDLLERYVHVTTPEVLRLHRRLGARESNRFNPSTPYAVSRAAGDMALTAYFHNYGFPVLFTRAANVYGPGQPLYRIVPRTILAALSGQKLRLDGGGASTRVFIHMRDVSDATLRIALGGRLGETYHISGYELVSIRALVEAILSRLGKSFEGCVELGPERPGKDTTYMLDFFKLRSELGWRDRISLAEGIDDTINWAERFSSVLSELPLKYIHKA